MIDSLPNLPGLARHGVAVRRAFASAVDLLGWRQGQADALAALIEHESGWRADAVNRATGASGLIQFMPATARNLGTTVEALRGMDELGQLPFVVRYFRPLGPNLAPADVPVAAFLPSMIGDPDDAVCFEMGTIGYTQNRGLDRNDDGRIELGEVRRDVLRLLDAVASKPRLPVDTGAPLPDPVPGGRVAGGASGGGAALLLVAVAALFVWRAAA